MTKVCCVCGSTARDHHQGDLLLSDVFTDHLALALCPAIQYEVLLRQCLHKAWPEQIRLPETDDPLCIECAWMLEKFHRLKCEIESIEQFMFEAYQKKSAALEEAIVDDEKTFEIPLITRTYCGPSNKSKRLPLSVHAKTDVAAVKTTECSNCGKKKSSIDVCDHIEARLTNIKEYYCEVNYLLHCGTYFYSSKKLYFSIQKCEDTFYGEQFFVAHVENVHCTCLLCNRTYKSVQALRIHAKKSHSG